MRKHSRLETAASITTLASPPPPPLVPLSPASNKAGSSPILPVLRAPLPMKRGHPVRPCCAERRFQRSGATPLHRTHVHPCFQRIEGLIFTLGAPLHTPPSTPSLPTKRGVYFPPRHTPAHPHHLDPRFQQSEGSISSPGTPLRTSTTSTLASN